MTDSAVPDANDGSESSAQTAEQADAYTPETIVRALQDMIGSMIADALRRHEANAH